VLQVRLQGTAVNRGKRYLSYAQISETSHASTKPEAAPARRTSPCVKARDNEWLLILGAIFERQKPYDKAEEEFKKSH